MKLIFLVLTLVFSSFALTTGYLSSASYTYDLINPMIWIFSHLSMLILTNYTANYLIKPKNERQLMPFKHKILAIMRMFYFFTISYYFNTMLPMKSVDYTTIYPKAYACNLICEFFIYWIHRFYHTVPKLYKNIHKYHHEYQYPSVLSTYHMSVIEITEHQLIWTSIFYIMNLSFQEALIINAIFNIYFFSGHLGVPADTYLYPFVSSSLLDHEYHHNKSIYNFGNNVNIYDKLFGTYKKHTTKN